MSPAGVVEDGDWTRERRGRHGMGIVWLDNAWVIAARASRVKRGRRGWGRPARSWGELQHHALGRGSLKVEDNSEAV